MTVQVGIEWDLLEADMPAVPCEHSQHDTLPAEHEGPATYFVQAGCPDCDRTPEIYAACQRFVEVFLQSSKFFCPRCFRDGDPSSFVTIIGPIKK